MENSLKLLETGGFLRVEKGLIRKVGINAAVLYANILEKKIYFRNNKINRYYLLRNDIEYDTGLTIYKQRTAEQKLIDAGIISIQSITDRHHHTHNYYDVDIERKNQLTGENGKREIIMVNKIIARNISINAALLLGYIMYHHNINEEVENPEEWVERNVIRQETALSAYQQKNASKELQAAELIDITTTHNDYNVIVNYYNINIDAVENYISSHYDTMKLDRIDPLKKINPTPKKNQPPRKKNPHTPLKKSTYPLKKIHPNKNRNKNRNKNINKNYITAYAAQQVACYSGICFDELNSTAQYNIDNSNAKNINTLSAHIDTSTTQNINNTSTQKTEVAIPPKQDSNVVDALECEEELISNNYDSPASINNVDVLEFEDEELI